MKQGRILHDGVMWVEHAERALSMWERMRGLLGRAGLGVGAALLIERCGAVHTLGMRFALDLVFLDRSWEVTRIVRNVRPGRLMVRGGVHAVRVIECETGCVDVSDLHQGDGLEWEDSFLPRGGGLVHCKT